MSPHGITGPLDQSSPIQGIHVIGQTPNAAKFLRAPTKRTAFKIFEPVGCEKCTKVH